MAKQDKNSESDNGFDLLGLLGFSKKDFFAGVFNWLKQSPLLNMITGFFDRFSPGAGQKAIANLEKNLTGESDVQVASGPDGDNNPNTTAVEERVIRELALINSALKNDFSDASKQAQAKIQQATNALQSGQINLGNDFSASASAASAGVTINDTTQLSNAVNLFATGGISAEFLAQVLPLSGNAIAIALNNAEPTAIAQGPISTSGPKV